MDTKAAGVPREFFNFKVRGLNSWDNPYASSKKRLRMYLDQNVGRQDSLATSEASQK